MVCAVEPDPSGDDRSLLALQVAAEISPGQLTEDLFAQGFRAEAALLHREAGRDTARLRREMRALSRSEPLDRP